MKVGTRVLATDCTPPAPGVVAETPESYWQSSGDRLRRHHPGTVWVVFDANGVGAPWAVENLEVLPTAKQ